MRFLTHTQSPEIIKFDIILPYQDSADILIPHLFCIEKMISMNSMLGFFANNWHSVKGKRTRYLVKEAFSEPKSDKIKKRGGYFDGRYSNYSCRGPFYSRFPNSILKQRPRLTSHQRAFNRGAKSLNRCFQS